ncbi:CAP-Gly domain-containing linker protein 4-like [Clytia hemisphaerica]|uniref:CAP-Gly domain-containing linker protein 4-like n=1 Tax=Clytia hemisphaerica TaxID=252671 RepID=UPI0034D6A625
MTFDETTWLNDSSPVSPIKEPWSNHDAVDAPLCKQCENLNLAFLDPNCKGCYRLIIDPKTSIAQLFAIIRQWVPQVQKNMDLLVTEILKRGLNINDRDNLTDMTLLHYVAKAGADGMSDPQRTAELTSSLINKGILINAKCQWTDMSALHYAVFFDAYSVVKVILDNESFNDLDRPCKEYNGGSVLHIGCQNLSFKSVSLLLENSSNPHFVDESGKKPIDYIPNEDEIENEDVKKIASLMRDELTVAMQNIDPQFKQNLNHAVLKALGLDLHSRVIVAGKVGLLRFAGSTEFASGVWGGIELEEKTAKNDGSVAGVQYFQCKPNHGIFTPLTLVKKFDVDYLLVSPSPPASPVPANTSASFDNVAMFGLTLGEKVIVAGQKTGFVRYRGPTKFSPGTWVGVELEDPVGKNDGSVGDFRYFRCEPDRGIFAPLPQIQRIEEVIEEECSSIEIPNTIKKFQMKKRIEGDGEKKKIFLKLDLKSITPQEDIEEENDRDSLEESEQKSNEKRKHSRINPGVSANIQQLSQPKRNHQKLDRTLGAQINFTLKTGMSVYLNGQLGLVRFIGRVEFAKGVWLGVELRKPYGKNDGSVEGRRYFTCEQNYGLMTRPSRATCRGINCEQLIDLKFR